MLSTQINGNKLIVTLCIAIYLYRESCSPLLSVKRRYYRFYAKKYIFSTIRKIIHYCDV